MNLDRRYLAGAVASVGLAVINLLPFMPGPLTARLNASVLLVALGLWLAYRGGIAPLHAAMARGGAWLARLTPAAARRFDVGCIVAVVLGGFLNASFTAGDHKLSAPVAAHPLATILATAGLALLISRRLAARRLRSEGDAVLR